MSSLHDRAEYSKHPYFKTRRSLDAPPPLQMLKMHLPKAFWTKKQIKFLDVGCDHGDLLISAKKLGQLKIFGVEVSQRAARIAATRGVKVHPCPIESAPREFSKFDLITMIDVLEHVAQPKKIIAELFRRSSKGGYLYLETPNPRSFIYIIGIILSKTPFRHHSAMRRLFPCEHIQYFSPPALLESLKNEGWKIKWFGTKKLETSQLAVARPMATGLRLLQSLDFPGQRVLSCVLAQK